MQDFAGSTAVHLIGATGALAALLLLGARRGKYGADGKPRAIPGHNMPLFGLGILILWLGWFGFNPGSTLTRWTAASPRSLLVTQPRRRRRRAGRASSTATGRRRRSTSAWPATARSPRWSPSPRPSGYVEPWAAPIIGGVAGVIVPLGVYAIDKKIDDPVGALSAHGMAGIWGTLACGLFTAPRLAKYNARRRRRPALHGLVPPARRPGARRRGGVRVRVRPLLRRLLGDQEDLRPARHAPRRRTPAWTSPSTACTATRSSSSRRRSSIGYGAAPPVAGDRAVAARRRDHARRCPA